MKYLAQFQDVFGEQNRLIRKDCIFGKPPGRPGVPGTHSRCPGKNALFAQFHQSKPKETPGTPAGRTLCVPPGVPKPPSRCPKDFVLKSMCLLLSLGMLFLLKFSMRPTKIADRRRTCVRRGSKGEAQKGEVFTNFSTLLIKATSS